TGFQDFLFHYPKSEKAGQARANLDILEHKQTANSYKVAKFYDKQKYYRAAVIYYNEVIRQQPGSEESNEAKKRIDQLRAKFGEIALCRRLGLSRSVRLTGALKASFATVICLALSGCLGYHVGPVKPYYLRDVHTIAVPTFKNRTLVPRIEVLITDTVIKQL